MQSEKLLSISALVISIFALAVSIWQGMDNRSFNKLSVKPHFQVNPRLTGGIDSGLYLENAGTGTAFINAISLSSKGKSFDLTKNNASKLFESIQVKPSCYKESWPKTGAAIQAGREFPLIQVTKADLAACNLEIVKFLTEPDLKMNIKYTTPYGESLEFFDTISLSERELGVYFELINRLKNITNQ